MEPWVGVLIAAVVVADLALVAWLVTKARAATASRQQEYSEWLAGVQADPLRRRLYEAHWKARWRAGLGSLLDVFLSMAAAGAILLLLGEQVGFDPWDGLSDLEGALVTFSWIPLYLMFVFVWPRLYGTTPGLKAASIVAVCPRTGRPVDRARVRPPHKWDYRRDRVPDLLFVPADLLGTWE